MNIIELETQNGGRDWPLIVMAVPCQVCNAPMGEQCRSVVEQGSMLTQGRTRIDWHAVRKYDAARAWYAQKDAPKLPSEKDLDADAEETKIAADTDTPVSAPAPEGPRTKKSSVKK